MSNLIATLSAHGWTYTPASGPVPEKGQLPSAMPDDVFRLCVSFDVLASPSEVAWFFSYRDYLGASDSAFKWNEFELNDFDYAINDTQRVAVRKFWGRHFPIAMSVRDDHSYIAIGTAADNAGNIILGENSDEDEVSLLAHSLKDFSDLVDGFLSGRVETLLSRFF